MGSGMNLDPVAMKEVGTAIKSEEGEFKTLVERMNKHAGNLMEVWDSDASREFLNQWNTMYPSLQKLYQEFIPNISGFVISAADAYQEAEDAAKRAAQGAS